MILSTPARLSLESPAGQGFARSALQLGKRLQRPVRASLTSLVRHTKVFKPKSLVGRANAGNIALGP